MTVDIARARYADAIAATAKLRSTALRNAFARVPREAFLGPGPWSMARFAGPAGVPTYELTPDDDPVRIYEDAAIALDRVRVMNADGSDLAIGPADAIFVNAGVTQIKRCWLDALDVGARMLVPLTTDFPSLPHAIGIGRMLKLVRHRDRIDAGFVSSVGIYHCIGARDAQTASALGASLARDDADRVTTLRTDPHELCATCWFHTPTSCLSG